MPVDKNEITAKAMGGTELMANALEKYIDSKLLDKFQIIPSRVRDLDETKVRIYWCHDLPGDPESEHLKDGGWRKFHKIVFVSFWQRQKYIDVYGIPYDRTTVLQNAIDPIDRKIIGKPTEKVRLIYHTTPHRGLNILQAVYDKLSEKYKNNLHLDVYSSFDIYGWDERDKEFKDLIKALQDHNHITYHKSVSNEDVKKAVSKSDIFAYPSTWPETSCISLMEAMSAGLMCVHSDYGALPETAANWTYMYNFSEDINKHAETFLGCLDSAIDTMMKGTAETRLKGQKSYTDLYYNWELRKIQWTQLLNSLKDLPTEIESGNIITFDTGM